MQDTDSHDNNSQNSGENSTIDIKDSSKKLTRRRRNAYLFIALYAVMGVVSAVTADAMVTFLDIYEHTKKVAESLAIVGGVASMGSAACLLLIPKLGYKKLLIISVLVSMAGLYLVVDVHVTLVVFICTCIVVIGISLFDAILPPFLSCYVGVAERPKFFSTAIWTNVLGMVIGGYLGGYLIVYMFAQKLGVSYEVASKISEHVTLMSVPQLSSYAYAHKMVIIGYIAITALTLLPVLLLRERRSDYQNVEAKKGADAPDEAGTEASTVGHAATKSPAKEASQELKMKPKMDYKVLFTRYTLLFLLVVFLIRAGASLIIPYLPIMLNSMGIDRATTSAIISSQNFAMMLFVAISPWITKKVGRVTMYSGCALLSIPFMLLIVNGAAFGAYKVLVVGLALFFRSGFMNAGQPVQQSLPMEFVPKTARPAYNSIIFIVGGAAQFIAGGLGMVFLFSRPHGYSIAYYVTAVLYVIACSLFFIFFYKKYNRVSDTDEFGDKVEE